jgi:uncharacterized hydrophobic protein (TIGR00271 family)
MEKPKSKLSKEKIDNKPIADSKEALKQDAKGLFKTIRIFFKELLNFRKDTDRDETVLAIKNDISFKGATAWILVFAVFIASIGLNVSSAAIVIGAMLISPLMGPILGVGMALAINDIDTLKKSLVNLSVMVLLSLLTAFLYFELSPLTELTPELESRIRPTILDVLVAIFGGLALIVARTKKGTIASVIFGVAISTALMPPLCTAGYGLAVGNLEFFLGAMYLFTINTIFIALSTFLVLKLLRFPMLKYADSKKRRRIARLASVVAIIIVIPAFWTFGLVLKESNFNKDAKAFINKELVLLPHSDYIKRNTMYKYSRDHNASYIEFNTFGLDLIPDSTITQLKERMKSYKSLTKTQLNFNQDNYSEFDNIKDMEELLSKDSLNILTQIQKISLLEEQVKSLYTLNRHQIPFKDISREVKLIYENIDQFSYTLELTTDFSKIDTIPVFKVKWKHSVTNKAENLKAQIKLEQWLKLRLKLNTVVVRQEN